MIDKKLEQNIKNTKEFIELWTKFHQIFEKNVSMSHLDKREEEEFVFVRELLNSRFEDLMDSLGIKPLKRLIMCPPIGNILALAKLSSMSDDVLKAFDRDWEEASKFLGSLLGRLERKKDRIEDFNKFAFIVKRKVTFHRKG